MFSNILAAITELREDVIRALELERSRITCLESRSKQSTGVQTSHMNSIMKIWDRLGPLESHLEETKGRATEKPDPKIWAEWAEKLPAGKLPEDKTPASISDTLKNRPVQYVMQCSTCRYWGKNVYDATWGNCNIAETCSDLTEKGTTAFATADDESVCGFRDAKLSTRDKHCCSMWIRK